MLRGVRLNLVLWSGGITLAVLVVLGVVLYLAVDRSLTASGTAELVAQANRLTGGRPGPDDLPAGGFIFGGRGSGTFSVVIDDAGRAGRAGPGAIPDGLPVMASSTPSRDRRARHPQRHDHDVVRGSAGRAGRRDRPGVVETFTETTTRSACSRPGRVPRPAFYLQVVGDRTTEERTLQILVVVLVLGGIVALLVASGVGAMYASRALVPIRQSLAASASPSGASASSPPTRRTSCAPR